MFDMLIFVFRIKQRRYMVVFVSTLCNRRYMVMVDVDVLLRRDTRQGFGLVIPNHNRVEATTTTTTTITMPDLSHMLMGLNIQNELTSTMKRSVDTGYWWLNTMIILMFSTFIMTITQDFTYLRWISKPVLEFWRRLFRTTKTEKLTSLKIL